MKALAGSNGLRREGSVISVVKVLRPRCIAGSLIPFHDPSASHVAIAGKGGLWLVVVVVAGPGAVPTSPTLEQSWTTLKT